MDQAKQLRSDCPISFTLDIVGDKWSLLIVRDAVFANKQTFSEFLQSDEGIARNILADRLNRLTEKGIFTKQAHPVDGRKDIYTLTEKGLQLLPMLLYMASWGSNHEPRTHMNGLVVNNSQDRQQLIADITKDLRKKITIGKEA